MEYDRGFEDNEEAGSERLSEEEFDEFIQIDDDENYENDKEVEKQFATPKQRSVHKPSQVM